jgi:hypothetical protein
MRLRKLLGLAAVALALCAGSAQAQTKLRYKFKEGEKLPYGSNTDAVITMTVAGTDVEAKLKLNAEADLTVQKVDQDGNARVRMKMGRVKMSLESATANGEFDSAAKDAEPEGLGKLLATIGKQLADLDVTFTLAPDGSTKDVKTAKGKKEMKKAPGGMDKLLGDLFSAEALQDAFALPQFPKEAVAKGKSWQEKKTFTSPVGKMTATVKYTYEGEVEKGGKKLEKIAIVPNLKGKGGADPGGKMPFKVTIKSAKGKGHAFFDNEAGRLVESVSETTMDAELDLGGIMVPARVTQTTNLRLKRPGPKSR